MNSQVNISELYEREFNYCTSIALAKTLKSKGLLTDKEYAEIEWEYIEKYDPPIAKLRHKM